MEDIFMKFVSEFKLNEFYFLVVMFSINNVNVIYVKFVKLKKMVYLKVCYECYLNLWNDFLIFSVKYLDYIVVVWKIEICIMYNIFFRINFGIMFVFNILYW